MEKPYELKVLGEMIFEECKKDGLLLAEQAIEKLGKSAYMALKIWAKQSAIVSENKVDDFAAQFYDYVDQYVIPQIEKLDLDGDKK